MIDCDLSPHLEEKAASTAADNENKIHSNQEKDGLGRTETVVSFFKFIRTELCSF